jgi:hypothetical protein
MLNAKELHSLQSPPHIILVIKIKYNKMGGECSMYGRDERCIQNFGGKKPDDGYVGVK